MLEALDDRERRARDDGLGRPRGRIFAFHYARGRGGGDARGEERLRLDEADAAWAGYAPRDRLERGRSYLW